MVTVGQKPREPLVDGHLDVLPTGTQAHKARIHDDPMEPRRDPTAALEATAGPERRHERILEGFARVIVIPKQSPGDRQQPSGVFADHLLERAQISGTERRYEHWVVHALRLPCGPPRQAERTLGGPASK